MIVIISAKTQTGCWPPAAIMVDSLGPIIAGCMVVGVEWLVHYCVEQ